MSVIWSENVFRDKVVKGCLSPRSRYSSELGSFALV